MEHCCSAMSSIRPLLVTESDADIQNNPKHETAEYPELDAVKAESDFSTAAHRIRSVTSDTSAASGAGVKALESGRSMAICTVLSSARAFICYVWAAQIRRCRSECPLFRCSNTLAMASSWLWHLS